MVILDHSINAVVKTTKEVHMIHGNMIKEAGSTQATGFV